VPYPIFELLSVLPAAYTPFLRPLPVWNSWVVLLLPLCVAVAVVYKSIKCHTMSQVPAEAAKATAYILVGMALAGAVLMGVVWLLER
jgi:hypothetical protein